MRSTNRLALLAFLLFMVALPLIRASGTGNNFLDCSTLFGNNLNGHGIVSPAIAAYSSYSGLISLALLIVMMMFILMGLLYGLGMAFRYDTLKNFVRTEYIEGFVSIMIIVFIGAGIAAFNGSISFITGLFSLFSGGSIATSPLGLYTSLCNNIFSNMIVPGIVNYVWVLANQIMISVISGFTINLAPGHFGITFVPFAGFALVNQLIWTEQAITMFMITTGGVMIVMLFLIYYLFPIFLFVGVALRTFPWTRAAGGAFISLFIAFYIFFPAIMYPFTGIYSVNVNPSGSSSGICGSGSSGCGSSFWFYLSSFKAYIGVLTFDVGYTAYTNLQYFSQICAYLGIQILGLIISLLISYELVGIFGRLFGAPSLRGESMFSKIFVSRAK